MPTEEAEATVTAFMLIKTTPEWLAMTVQEWHRERLRPHLRPRPLATIAT